MPETSASPLRFLGRGARYGHGKAEFRGQGCRFVQASNAIVPRLRAGPSVSAFRNPASSASSATAATGGPFPLRQRYRVVSGRPSAAETGQGPLFWPRRSRSRRDLPRKSGETIYIAGGAVVYGKIRPTRSRGPRPRPRHPRWRSWKPWETNLVVIKNSADIEIRGIILRDSPGWNVVPRAFDRVTITSVKIFGYRKNSDGIDVVNSATLWSTTASCGTTTTASSSRPRSRRAGRGGHHGAAIAWSGATGASRWA